MDETTEDVDTAALFDRQLLFIESYKELLDDIDISDNENECSIISSTQVPKRSKITNCEASTINVITSTNSESSNLLPSPIAKRDEDQLLEGSSSQLQCQISFQSLIHNQENEDNDSKAFESEEVVNKSTWSHSTFNESEEALYLGRNRSDRFHHEPEAPITSETSVPQSEEVVICQNQIQISSLSMRSSSISLERPTIPVCSQFHNDIASARTGLNISQVTISTTNSTQSSIYSSRWENVSYGIPQEPSTSLQNTEESINDEDATLENETECIGWDESWSVEVDFKTCIDSGRSVFSKVEQSLLKAHADVESCQVVFTHLAQFEEGKNTLNLAPGCDRLRRRLLHRPSQESTQTTAAPLSALQWTRHLKSHVQEFSKDIRFQFGYRYLDKEPNVTLGSKIGRKCRELNEQLSINSGRNDAFLCGWMTGLEMSEALDALKTYLDRMGSDVSSILFDFTQTIVQSQVITGNSLGLTCLVKQEYQAEAVIQALCNSENESFIESYHFKHRPLIARLMGPWRPSNSWDRFIILDIKFMHRDNKWDWAVQAFFCKPSFQVRDIIARASDISTTFKISSSHYPRLKEFCTAITILARDYPVTSWDELLTAYRDIR